MFNATGNDLWNHDMFSFPATLFTVDSTIFAFSYFINDDKNPQNIRSACICIYIIILYVLFVFYVSIETEMLNI